MASTLTATVPGDVSLEQLNTRAKAAEQGFGPLLSIGNDGSATVLAFDGERDIPDNEVVLKPTVAGHPIPQPGMLLLCLGIALIVGQETSISAYRKIS
jgi:hypothetical protein